MPAEHKLSFFRRQMYMYDLWTGLYMLEPWEKALFNSIIFVSFATTCYVIMGWVQAGDAA